MQGLSSFRGPCLDAVDQESVHVFDIYLQFVVRHLEVLDSKQCWNSMEAPLVSEGCELSGIMLQL
jgi:hypothetical protein